MPAKQYEVVIRYYPISPDRAETIHVIHQFKANHRYMFKMYRDKSNRSGVVAECFCTRSIMC